MSFQDLHNWKRNPKIGFWLHCKHEKVSEGHQHDVTTVTALKIQIWFPDATYSPVSEKKYAILIIMISAQRISELDMRYQAGSSPNQ